MKKIESKERDSMRLLLGIIATVLVSRIVSTFSLAFVLARDWTFEYMWDWFPIIAFHTDDVTFRRLNSYSILITTVVVTAFFIFHFVKSRKREAGLWLLGIWVTALQFVIALFLNRFFHFSTDPMVGIPILLIILVTSFLYYKKYKKELKVRK